MRVSAIVVMCLALVTVWGGPTAAVIDLRRHRDDRQD